MEILARLGGGEILVRLEEGRYWSGWRRGDTGQAGGGEILVRLENRGKVRHMGRCWVRQTALGDIEGGAG